jgi:hypothetical protein
MVVVAVAVAVAVARTAAADFFSFRFERIFSLSSLSITRTYTHTIHACTRAHIRISSSFPPSRSASPPRAPFFRALHVPPFFSSLSLPDHKK